MSEHFEDPPEHGGPKAPNAGRAGDVDLPADFFQDLEGPPPPDAGINDTGTYTGFDTDLLSPDNPHSGHLSLDAAGPDDPFNPGGKPSPAAAPAFSPPTAKAVAYIPPPPAPAEPAKGGGGFPIAMALALTGLVAGAVYLSMQPKPTPASPPPAAPVAAAATPETPPSSDAVAGQVKKVEADLAGLSEQFKALQAKVDALPKAAPEPDLKPVQERIDALAKSVEPVAKLPETVASLEKQVSTLEAGLEGTKGELKTLSDGVKKASEDAEKAVAAAKPAETKPAEAATTPAAGTPGSFSAGSKLYAAGRYADAAAEFKKGTDAGEKDARIYYLAALSQGLSGVAWTGEPARLMTEGAKLEKAGTPAKAEIDTAVSNVPASAKTWFYYYRGLAR